MAKNIYAHTYLPSCTLESHGELLKTLVPGPHKFTRTSRDASVCFKNLPKVILMCGQGEEPLVQMESFIV